MHHMSGGETFSGSSHKPQVLTSLFSLHIKSAREECGLQLLIKETPAFLRHPRRRIQAPASCSWGEFMDEVSLKLPTLFRSLTDERKEADKDEESIAHLLEEEGEEDENDIPPNPSRPGTTLSEGSPSPAQV